MNTSTANAATVNTKRQPKAGFDEVTRLIRFAKATLAILEEQEEWSSHTTDDIARNAITLRLAGTDHFGLFKSKVSNPKGQP